MNYRDEEDIFEEDIVFDQAGLLSSARKRGKSAIRRVSSGRCAMLSKTLALCGAFFGLGLSITLPGPATPMPPTDLDTQNGGEEYIYRCLGFMLGAILGGMLLDRFNRLFLVFLALLACAILVAMVPWKWDDMIWLLRSDLIFLGATLGFLLTGGNVLCLDLWGQNSGPFMQALHFSFSLGAFLAPLIASPLSPAVSTVLPITEHHRPARDINDDTVGFAEGLRPQSYPPLSFRTTLAAPISSVAPVNQTSTPFLSSQPALERNFSTLSVKKTSTSEDISSISSSTTALSHSTHRTPKPKPEKNSGNHLDKASKWEGVHAGQPDPQDLATPSTKATTPAPPSSSSLAPSSSSVASTAQMNKTSTTISATSTTSTKLRIKEIFQDEPVSTKVQSTGNKTNDNVTKSVSVNDTVTKSVSVVKDQNVDVNVERHKSGDAISTSSPSPNTSLTDQGNQTSPLSGTTSTSTTMAPVVDTQSSPKPSQPTLGTVTTTSRFSTVKLPDITKSTTSTTTSSPATSSSPTPATVPSSVVPPKSFTLTEKKTSTVPTPGTPLKPLDAPFPSLSTPTTPSTKPTNDKHVEVTMTLRRHHSKPTSYDNDTDQIYSVMDEVADHFGKEYGLNRRQLSYLLVALLLFVVSLLFLGFLCFNPRDPRSRSEEDVGGGRSNVIRPRWIRITLTTLMMLLLALSAGVQFSYGHLLVLFAMRSSLALSHSTGTALTATYWGAATSTRLACILLASALSPGALLVISVALTAAATWLLSALATQSAAALWVGAVLVAVGTASILPSSFLWMQHHVHVSHHVAGMLVMGPAMGEMLFPPLALRVIKSVGPSGLVHLPALFSLAVIALWAAAWRLARHPCSSLCAHADPAAHTYQLASQTDEDDLLDLTMSPVTHRGGASVGRRTSSHVNGNGVHRLST